MRINFKALTGTAAVFFCFVVLAPLKLCGVLSPNLGSVIVYPNPFQPGLSHKAVVFDNLTANARIRIYKITGELVNDFSVDTIDGKVAWDVTNNEGSPLATGVYVYLITNSSGQKTSGKIAILK